MTCDDCKHLRPGKFTDPTPELSRNEVCGCELQEPFMGVHRHTGACSRFEPCEVLGGNEEWHH